MPGVEALLDTTVLLHYFRWNKFAEQVEADYSLRARGFAPTISVVSIGELLAFARNPAWDEVRRDKLRAFIEQCIAIDISQEDVLAIYAELHDLNKRNATNIGQNDLWIAACAKAAGLAVLTSDADFLRLPSGAVGIIKVHPKSGVTEARL